MPNISPPTGRDGYDYLTPILAEFDRFRAAERREQQRTERQPMADTGGEIDLPTSPAIQPRALYLHLWYELSAVQAKLLDGSPAVIPAFAGAAPPPFQQPPSGTLRRFPRWWTALRHTARQPAVQRAAAYFIALCFAGASVSAYNAYAASLRTRPTTISYVNAPLSDVVTELRRRTELDIRACNIVPGKDRVTLTLTDIPIDSILRRIGKQDELLVHWWWFPKTVLLQPRINTYDGSTARHNLYLLFVSLTTMGCRP